MFVKNLPGLSGVFALAKRCATRSYLAVALLPLLVLAGLQTPGGPNTGTFIGNSVIQQSNFVPWTGMIGNAPTQHWPGHDFGAIGNASGLKGHLPAAVMPFFYSLHNGTIVVRNSELGSMTGTVGNSFSTRGPGHDFGAIGGDQ
jgi:hypothetical protein